jgi:hypothetical protein
MDGLVSVTKTQFGVRSIILILFNDDVLTAEFMYTELETKAFKNMSLTFFFPWKIRPQFHYTSTILGLNILRHVEQLLGNDSVKTFPP